MELTIVGSGTAVPAAGHSPAASVVRAGDAILLLDIGPGSVSRLATLGIAHRDVDVVCLSHRHADHVLDLVVLLQTYGHTPGWSRSKELVVIGGPGIERFLGRLLDLFPDARPDDYLVTVMEPRGSTIDVAGWHVETTPTGHTPDAVAFRVSRGGSSLVYTGDAVDVPAIARLADGANTLLAECSYPDGWTTANHFTASDAGRAAAQARVERLVLTHRYPPAIDADVKGQASAHFSGEILAAEDGLCLTV